MQLFGPSGSFADLNGEIKNLAGEDYNMVCSLHHSTFLFLDGKTAGNTKFSVRADGDYLEHSLYRDVVERMGLASLPQTELEAYRWEADRLNSDYFSHRQLRRIVRPA